MDVNRANHQYSLEIPDPGAQSFACYAITARVRAHAWRWTGRSFMLLSAGEEPTLGEEARHPRSLQDHLSGSSGTAVSRRNLRTLSARNGPRMMAGTSCNPLPDLQVAAVDNGARCRAA